MLKKVFKALDDWAIEKNRAAFDLENVFIPATEILIIGQSALLETRFDFPIIATMDVDAYNQFDFKLRDQFNELLKEEGRHLDSVGHEAWMPQETVFKALYSGKIIQGKIAEAVYVIISKAKKAPLKNKNLIADYLASKHRDDQVFELAEKYQINFGEIL